MKRIITASFFLAAAIFIAIFGYCDLQKSSKQLIAALDETIACVDSGENDQSVSAAAQGVALWKSKDKRFQVYLNHDDLEQLQLDFKALERYCHGDSSVEPEEICKDCIDNINRITELEKPSFGTVF